MAVPPETAQPLAHGFDSTKHKPVETRSQIVIRFAGDSGDGMQLAGMQFTTESALAGNDIATLPDFQRRFAPLRELWPESAASN